MALLGNGEKHNKTWELSATVLEKFSGTGGNGEAYFRVKIGGFTFFNRDLYYSVEEGDKVILSGEYVGDQYSRKSQSYSPRHELTDVMQAGTTDVPGGFADIGTIPRLNGAKMDKGQPA